MRKDCTLQACFESTKINLRFKIERGSIFQTFQTTIPFSSLENKMLSIAEYVRMVLKSNKWKDQGVERVSTLSVTLNCSLFLACPKTMKAD